MSVCNKLHDMKKFPFVIFDNYVGSSLMGKPFVITVNLCVVLLFKTIAEYVSMLSCVPTFQSK